jgi:hypothetical protein
MELINNTNMNKLSRKIHLKTKDYLPRAYLYPSTNLAQFHGKVFGFFGSYTDSLSHFEGGIPNFFGPSTTNETRVVEMRIWCIKIGIVLVFYK